MTTVSQTEQAARAMPCEDAQRLLGESITILMHGDRRIKGHDWSYLLPNNLLAFRHIGLCEARHCWTLRAMLEQVNIANPRTN